MSLITTLEQCSAWALLAARSTLCSDLISNRYTRQRQQSLNMCLYFLRISIHVPELPGWGLKWNPWKSMRLDNLPAGDLKAPDLTAFHALCKVDNLGGSLESPCAKHILIWCLNSKPFIATETCILIWVSSPSPSYAISEIHKLQRDIPKRPGPREV